MAERSAPFPPSASNDRAVVLEAVTADGEALEHASEVLRGDVDVVLAAVAQSALALQWASDELRGSSDVFQAAIAERAGDGPVAAYLRRTAAMDYTTADFSVVAVAAMAPKVSPDGILLARWEPPNVLSIDSAETREVIHAMEIPMEHASAVVGFEYAEDTLSVVLGLGGSAEREGEYVVVDLEKLCATLHRPSQASSGEGGAAAGAAASGKGGGAQTEAASAFGTGAARVAAVIPPRSTAEPPPAPFCFNFTMSDPR